MATLVVFPNLEQKWWVLLLRGIFAILFALIAFAWPGVTLLILTTLFAVYAFVDGVFALAAGLHTHWPMLIVLGVIGIIAGLLAFFFPGITALTLVFIIAGWAIIRGAAEIAAAVQLRKVIPNEWSLILEGVLSVLFGVLLFAWPAVGILTVIWIIGIYALLAGILLIVTGFRVKTHPWQRLAS
jgi:uncharacterized membrane protein HdeD (DUF308 family)